MGSVNDPKTSDNTPVHKPGVLVPQPHGGAIRRGGTGQGGRPAARIRRKLQQIVEKGGTELLQKAIAGQLEGASAADQLRAVDIAARYGIGQTREVSVENVQERLRQTIQIIEDNFATCKSAEELLAMIEPVWK